MLVFIHQLKPQLKRCHSESQLKECHVFTLYPEPQLKGYHSKPQLKECHNKSILKAKTSSRPSGGTLLPPSAECLRIHCLYRYSLVGRPSSPGATLSSATVCTNVAWRDIHITKC
ncbi:hypothetical protein DEO72_LG8g2962 [Vigna unguiculata]|uniref:Uncharacterized protein n=1 Tax=Vigna unguiculata TaxID=3917 RepID=A0A4D6MTT2_VIGUN|nr:hypothetical protein DEO72_LG8g2962 [Vigna unguiculata]